MNIPIRLSVNAKLPTRARTSDAGYDLYAAHDYILVAGQRGLIDTGVSLAIPEGYYGRVAPRSGLAVKYGIDVLAGVVDASFRGNIGVVLFNTSNNDFKIEAGDRIAQLIIESCHTASFIVVDYLDETQRGAGGFGSSGR